MMEYFWIEQHVHWGYGDPGYWDSYSLVATAGSRAAVLWSWSGPGTGGSDPRRADRAQIAVGRQGQRMARSEFPAAVAAREDLRKPHGTYRILTEEQVRAFAGGDALLAQAAEALRPPTEAELEQRRAAREFSLRSHRELVSSWHRAADERAGLFAGRTRAVQQPSGPYRARGGQSRTRRCKARVFARVV
jgi:hypothetical protein